MNLHILQKLKLVYIEYSLDTWGDEKLNAVNLNTHKLDGFDYNVEVILMNGTFMIEK